MHEICIVHQLGWASAEAILKVELIQQDKHQFHIRKKSDLDYAKDTQTRLSISGYVVYLEDAPIMHRSVTQKMVALSSCKAELNAVVLCVQDMMYQRSMLESIGLKVELPMILDMDNKKAVNLMNSFSVGGHTQHINVKQRFLQELKKAKLLAL